ncbi:MAG: efflux RND transporter periplasmic adaptor subunit [Tepidisphaeraceae bacterium]
MRSVESFGWIILSLVATTSAPAPAQSASGMATAITRPSEERKLTFPGMGIIADVEIKEGDQVKSGQVLIVQDDYIDQKEHDRLLLEANSTARIEAAEADLKVKKSEYARKKKMFDEGAGNTAEIEEAENNAILREKQLMVAREDQAQARIKVEQAAGRVDRMHLKSPIDGIVAKVVVNVGEMSDPQNKEGAVIVVKNDPLYVEIRDLSTKQAAKLTMGQKLKVRYTDDPDAPENWQEGEVFFFSPVAESTAETRMVKLRLANPSGRPAGLWMVVKLPDDLAGADHAPDRTAAAGK